MSAVRPIPPGKELCDIAAGQRHRHLVFRTTRRGIGSAAQSSNKTASYESSCVFESMYSMHWTTTTVLGICLLPKVLKCVSSAPMPQR